MGACLQRNVAWMGACLQRSVAWMGACLQRSVAWMGDVCNRFSQLICLMGNFLCVFFIQQCTTFQKFGNCNFWPWFCFLLWWICIAGVHIAGSTPSCNFISWWSSSDHHFVFNLQVVWVMMIHLWVSVRLDLSLKWQKPSLSDWSQRQSSPLRNQHHHCRICIIGQRLYLFVFWHMHLSHGNQRIWTSCKRL
jgi:hypothetical protein